jgi:hypothetical protein
MNGSTNPWQGMVKEQIFMFDYTCFLLDLLAMVGCCTALAALLTTRFIWNESPSLRSFAFIHHAFLCWNLHLLLLDRPAFFMRGSRGLVGTALAVMDRPMPSVLFRR